MYNNIRHFLFKKIFNYLYTYIIIYSLCIPVTFNFFVFNVDVTKKQCLLLLKKLFVYYLSKPQKTKPLVCYVSGINTKYDPKVDSNTLSPGHFNGNCSVYGIFSYILFYELCKEITVILKKPSAVSRPTYWQPCRFKVKQSKRETKFIFF